jgi:hypothetical protein
LLLALDMGAEAVSRYVSGRGYTLAHGTEVCVGFHIHHERSGVAAHDRPYSQRQHIQCVQAGNDAAGIRVVPSVGMGRDMQEYDGIPMKRTALKRGTSQLARKPMKPATKRINPNRSEQRRGPARDRGYMDWLKENCNCAVCRRGPNRFECIDPAHTQNNGSSSKGPDSSCIPLCRMHHLELDGALSTRVTSRSAFEAKYGMSLEETAKAHYAAYLLLKEAR